MIKRFILNRLKEASTYKGLLVLLGMFGVALDPNQSDAIVTACVAIYGAVSLFLPNVFGAPIESKKSPVEVKPDVPDALGDGEVATKWDGKVGNQFP